MLPEHSREALVKDDHDEWLSLERIAKELGVPVRTIYAWRNRGDAPRGYKIGRHVRVKRSDLDAWLERQADPVRVA